MDNELSKIIGERINTLLAKNDFKQKDLSDWTGIKPENTISYFCSGKRIPNTSQLKKIAEFFNTTTDYLLGLSDSPSNEVEFIKLTELTGLCDEAIEQLWEEYEGGWRGDNIQANEIMNKLVEEGVLGSLVREMTNYADYLTSHINYLTEIYQSAKKQYEKYALQSLKQMSKRENGVVVSDEARNLSLVAIDDESEFRKGMRLSLFEMSEIPKVYVTRHFRSLYHQYETLISKIKELDRMIVRFRLEEANKALDTIQKKEGEPIGDDQTEE